MPEFQGMDFPDYVFAEFPKWVRNAAGEERLCGDQQDEEEWLTGQPAAPDAPADPGMRA